MPIFDRTTQRIQALISEQITKSHEELARPGCHLSMYADAKIKVS